jgi:hypothetical protein
MTVARIVCATGLGIGFGGGALLVRNSGAVPDAAATELVGDYACPTAPACNGTDCSQTSPCTGQAVVQVQASNYCRSVASGGSTYCDEGTPYKCAVVDTCMFDGSECIPSTSTGSYSWGQPVSCSD